MMFYMSSQPAVESSEASSKIVNIISGRLELSEAKVETLTIIVRKGAHFTEYLILSYLVIMTYGSFYNRKYNFSSILLVCLVVAVSDEFFQGFIEGRSSEVKDVIIDFSGSITCSILYYCGIHINRYEKKVVK